MALLDYRLEYKNAKAEFEYPKAYDYFELQNQVHWLWSEVPMGPDLQDWNLNLTPSEKNVIGNILKSFAQTEVIVNDYWIGKVKRWFPKPEIAMMCAAFGNMEAIHTKAYAYLNETLELEDYVGFLEDKASKDKIDVLTDSYVRGVNKKSIEYQKQIARSLAVFSAFTEGVSLFSSFAILLSFKMKGKLKKVGNIVEWSVRDESMHSQAGCWLFREFCKEYPKVVDDELKKSIYDSARACVELECKFIDKVFEQGAIESINPDDLKNFIKNRANVKLGDLGYKQNWKNIDKDALARMAWFDNATGGAQSTDFFDGRVTQYSKGNINWDKAFDFDLKKFSQSF
jgi:ribonucleoside-diphosphate reductase beta chain